MSIDITVPQLGESIVEATVVQWFKQEGDPVATGEALLELETEKVTLEVNANDSGVLARIERAAGEDVRIGDLLGVLDESAEAVEIGREAEEVNETESTDEAPAVGGEEREQPDAVFRRPCNARCAANGGRSGHFPRRSGRHGDGRSDSPGRRGKRNHGEQRTGHGRGDR